MKRISQQSETITLPDEVFMYIGDVPGKEKISFGICGSGKHFTITNNSERNVVNMHITKEGHQGVHPEQLFEINHFTLKRLIRKLEIEMPILLKKYFFSRIINLGRLKRYDLLLIPIKSVPEVERAIVNIGKKRFRSKKSIQRNVLEKLIKLPEEFITDASGYMLFSITGERKGYQGMIIKDRSRIGTRRYHLITRKVVNQFCRQQMHLIYSVLQGLEFKHKESILKLFVEKMRELSI